MRARLGFTLVVVVVALSLMSIVAVATPWGLKAATAHPEAQPAILDGVSCTSATACTAVGFSGTEATITASVSERWNGKSWAIQPTPHPSSLQGTALSSVSCTSPTSCIAVGYSGKVSTAAAFAEGWNGRKWTIQTTPHPTGSHATALAGVSCISPTTCTAVGYSTGSAKVPLAERWNGRTWTIQPTPDATRSLPTNLSSVSCASPTGCTAVGQSGIPNTATTLAERWNGTRWTIQQRPSSAGPMTALYKVSCTAPTTCTAVGFSGDPGGVATSSGPTTTSLDERWNGIKWTIQPTPNPSGSSYNVLVGVSCTSASTCTAVGESYPFSNTGTSQQSLAERWDGTKWTVQATPNPPPRPGFVTALVGVSCASPTACIAVGTSGTPGAHTALVEDGAVPNG